jgi:large-conductance mechanosensitive channel
MNSYDYSTLIISASALTIGMATLSLIKSSISDFIMPILFLIFVKGTNNIHRGTASFFQQVLINKDMHFTNFITEILTWLMVVVIAIFMTKQILKLAKTKEGFEMGTTASCPPCPPCPAVISPTTQPSMVNDEMANEMDYSNFYLNNN